MGRPGAGTYRGGHDGRPRPASRGACTPGGTTASRGHRRPGARPCTWPGESRPGAALAVVLIPWWSLSTAVMGPPARAQKWAETWPGQAAQPGDRIPRGPRSSPGFTATGYESRPEWWCRQQPVIRRRFSGAGDPRRGPVGRRPGASWVTICWPARRWRRPRSPPSGCGWRAYFTPWCTPTRGRCTRGACSVAASRRRRSGLHLQSLGASRWTWGSTEFGIALLVAAPWLTAAVGTLDARAARALLGPSRAEELEYRAENLARDPGSVVDAADAERRRLERDLHDGTQRRLVSLAMRLGMARANLPTRRRRTGHRRGPRGSQGRPRRTPNLVRGLHPAVLEDRGLDAALSGVAARMPIPVRVTVDVPRQPSPTIEAVAYFVVSEGSPTSPSTPRQAGGGIRAAGQQPAAHHRQRRQGGQRQPGPRHRPGRAGQRAASVDGTFEVVSPPGGPTLITVDLPCAR